jgi:Flp pilus assembly protein TadD
MKLYEVLKSGGVNELESSLKQILEANGMLYKDRHLNAFGYELMNNNKLDDAIKVFELNAKLFPNVPNVYDSLGEAYMNAGKKDLAIANYKKVLELAPNNQNAKKKLEQLQN